METSRLPEMPPALEEEASHYMSEFNHIQFLCQSLKNKVAQFQQRKLEMQAPGGILRAIRSYNTPAMLGVPTAREQQEDIALTKQHIQQSIEYIEVLRGRLLKRSPVNTFYRWEPCETAIPIYETEDKLYQPMALVRRTDGNAS